MISPGETRIEVRVQPGASKNEVAGFAGGALRVRIAAPPVRGKANQELIAFLSEMLGVHRSRVAIVSGYTARSKVISIAGLSREEVLRRLLPEGKQAG